jgi:hypothetical protein
MPRIKLIKSAIDGLPTPQLDTVFWDTGCPGFGVKLRRRVGKYSSFSTGQAVPARSYANTQSDHMGA